MLLFWVYWGKKKKEAKKKKGPVYYLNLRAV
jgi:hypothetical protein